MAELRAFLTATAFVLLAVFLTGPAAAAPHLIVEVANGKVVSKKQEFDRWYPASLTKLMTAYTVFQEMKAGRLSKLSPVKVSKHALSQPPSKMGFPEGTVLNIDTAIKILMVKSANDIASATAEAAGGSEPEFVSKMNGHAARLGMRDTRFTNPHGLHDPGQYTSARDMAVLALALKKEFPEHAGYFRIPAIKVGKRTLQNHNPLIQRFDGATGMKTGFVCAAGLNIVASVKRGPRELVAVVLGGPTGQERNVRVAKLLTESFKKSSFFVREKLETMRPSGFVRTQPTDMRESVCTRKKKNEKKASDIKKGAVFALQQPSLDDLEKEYLREKGHNTRVIPIVLGNATGPDPYQLLAGTPVSNVSAYVASGGSVKDWPVVFGTKRVKVPLPSPRPRN